MIYSDFEELLKATKRAHLQVVETYSRYGASATVAASDPSGAVSNFLPAVKSGIDAGIDSTGDRGDGVIGTVPLIGVGDPFLPPTPPSAVPPKNRLPVRTFSWLSSYTCICMWKPHTCRTRASPQLFAGE
jgi:hypothetical protein